MTSRFAVAERRDRDNIQTGRTTVALPRSMFEAR